MLYSMSSNEKDTKERILEATWQLMEQHNGQNLSMGAVAKATGISRQAVYLHFASRTELMIATTQYVDELKGLNQRFVKFETAKTGIERLEAIVDVWGNYIPEIYGLAKALLNTRDTDEATAAAWDGCMGCLRDVCQLTVESLEQEGRLAPEWTKETAIEMFWTMISISNWEQLTVECGWTTKQYVERMKVLLIRSFINNA